jgi:hypothetical protein
MSVSFVAAGGALSSLLVPGLVLHVNVRVDPDEPQRMTDTQSSSLRGAWTVDSDTVMISVIALVVLWGLLWCVCSAVCPRRRSVPRPTAPRHV